MQPHRPVNRFLRLGLLSVIALGGFVRAEAQRDLSFEPYSVYVADEKSHARCGPSDEYYRTDPLRIGQELRVYAETDDGWLGIRPPADSFCWIPADTIELSEREDIGTIIEDRTVAWIGTHLGRARKYRWQVQLAHGEPVTVIGKSEREGPDGPQLWYRIVPPSGEYRWVHRDQVVTSSEELVTMIESRTQSEKATQRDSEKQTNRVAKNRPRRPTKLRRDASSRRRSDVSASRTQGSASQTQGSGSSVLVVDEPDRKTASVKRRDGIFQPRDGRGDDEATGARFDEASDDIAIGDDEPIGSGVSHAIASAIEFIGRPRMIEIGSTPSAPAPAERAGDGNWVAGIGKLPRSLTPGEPLTQDPLAGSRGSGNIQQVSGNIRQVSGELPAARDRLTPTATADLKPFRTVSPARIAEIAEEVVDADIDGLSLVFSRLMAAQATSAEIDPIVEAANKLASTAADAVDAGRARLLAERAEQYQRVAQRRDGSPGSRPSFQLGPTTIEPTRTTAEQALEQPQLTPSPGKSPEDNQPPSVSGFLVQVYSARPNSPPFALTDRTGRTVAYVTPAPGINLRMHLNSRVTVQGGQGYLTGLNTPHIIASKATRTHE